jgi:hypothetical protein
MLLLCSPWPFHLDLAHHPVHALRVRHEAVEAALVLYVQPDEDEAGQPGGQTQQVDERVELLLPEVAEGSEEEVLEHGWSPVAS